MSYLLALADLWLGSYHYSDPTDNYRHATDSGLIPVDSYRPPDSNGPHPDSIRFLVMELSSSLYSGSPAR